VIGHRRFNPSWKLADASTANHAPNYLAMPLNQYRLEDLDAHVSNANSSKNRLEVNLAV